MRSEATIEATSEETAKALYRLLRQRKPFHSSLIADLAGLDGGVEFVISISDVMRKGGFAVLEDLNISGNSIARQGCEVLMKVRFNEERKTAGRRAGTKQQLGL